jgi:hypothetical protein
MMELSDRRHRFPLVVIQHAVRIYLRFTLNYEGSPDTQQRIIAGIQFVARRANLVSIVSPSKS